MFYFEGVVCSSTSSTIVKEENIVPLVGVPPEKNISNIEKWCENCVEQNLTFFKFIVYSWSDVRYLCSEMSVLKPNVGLVIDYR